MCFSIVVSVESFGFFAFSHWLNLISSECDPINNGQIWFYSIFRLFLFDVVENVKISIDMNNAPTTTTKKIHLPNWHYARLPVSIHVSSFSFQPVHLYVFIVETHFLMRFSFFLYSFESFDDMKSWNSIYRFGIYLPWPVLTNDLWSIRFRFSSLPYSLATFDMGI